MNTIQDAINHVQKKKLSYWMVKSTNGKLKGEYEGDDLGESIEELTDLCSHLITGKYELTTRNGKNNYRNAAVFDFEVYNNGFQQAQKQTPNTTGMDSQMFSMMVDIKTSLNMILMKLEANEKDTERKFKDLAKALSDVFDEKEEPKQLSPLEMVQGLKGMQSTLKDFSV